MNKKHQDSLKSVGAFLFFFRSVKLSRERNVCKDGEKQDDKIFRAGKYNISHALSLNDQKQPLSQHALSGFC